MASGGLLEKENRGEIQKACLALMERLKKLASPVMASTN
jgi:hypothetical protein